MGTGRSHYRNLDGSNYLPPGRIYKDIGVIFGGQPPFIPGQGISVKLAIKNPTAAALTYVIMLSLGSNVIGTFPPITVQPGVTADTAVLTGVAPAAETYPIYVDVTVDGILLTHLQIGTVVVSEPVITACEKYTAIASMNGSAEFSNINTWQAQAFRPDIAHDLGYVKLYLRKVGNPGGLYVYITDDNTWNQGLAIYPNILLSGFLGGPDIGASWGWVKAIFPSTLPVVVGARYHILCKPEYVYVEGYSNIHTIGWGLVNGGSGYKEDCRHSERAEHGAGITWATYGPGVTCFFEEGQN